MMVLRKLWVVLIWLLCITINSKMIQIKPNDFIVRLREKCGKVLFNVGNIYFKRKDYANVYDKPQL